MKIREFKDSDLEQMCRIWNEIVNEGNAFPQEDPLSIESLGNSLKDKALQELSG